MESPLDDFPSEPIAKSSGSTSDASQNQFAPIVDPVSRTRRSKKHQRHHVPALGVWLQPIRDTSRRAHHKSVAITKQVGSLLQRLPGAVERSWRATATWVESRRLKPRAPTSLADEVTHIAHDAGLTQDVVVASLQRAVAECVEREAARRTIHDHVGTPPRVVALVVAAALIAGVVYGIMWYGPWILSPAAAARPSGVAAVAPSLRNTVPVVNVTPASPAVGELPETIPSSVGSAAAVPIARPPGHLRIVTMPPGARVTVNGVGRGVTPLTIRHLPPGAKRVRVTKDGYAGAERMISLAGDAGRTVRIPLERMR
jgi:hypothetical protein